MPRPRVGHARPLQHKRTTDVPRPCVDFCRNCGIGRRENYIFSEPAPNTRIENFMTVNAVAPTGPTRKSIRLRFFDYSQPNAYFVTICTRNRACLFGRIINDAMHLNNVGRIAHDIWERISSHFPGVILDEWVVMPNHIHGIIIIADSVGGAASRRSPVSVVVGSYKSAVAKRIGNLKGTPAGSVWQRGYYDHVIRNPAAMDRIRRYIAENPARWSRDPENPEREQRRMPEGNL